MSVFDNFHKENIINKILVPGILVGYLLLFISTWLPLFTPKAFLSAAAGADYKSQVGAAKMLLDGNVKQTYDLEKQQKYQSELIDSKLVKALPFKGTIYTSLLYIPFAMLPYYQSLIFFIFTNLVLIFLFARYALNPKIKHFSLAVLLILFYASTTSAMILGQQSIFMLWFLVFIMTALKKGKSLLAGFLTGLLFIKPTFAILIPLLIIFRPWLASKRAVTTFLAGTLGSAAIFLLVNLFFFGPTFVSDYFHFLVNTDGMDHGSPLFYSYSFSTIANLLFREQSDPIRFSFALFLSLGAIVALVKILLPNVRKLGNERVYNILVTATLLLGIHTYNHDLAVLLLPFAMLINAKESLSKYEKHALILLIIAPIIGAISMYVLPGMVLLIATLLILIYPNSGKILNVGYVTTAVSVIIYMVYIRGTTDLKIGNGYVIASLATTPAQRQKGLMYVKNLPENRGMLFIMDHEGIHTFWMKNTYIPLDIIWLDKYMVVTDISRHAVPCKFEPCYTYKPRERTKFVLEVNAGWAERMGVKVGDIAHFSPNGYRNLE